VGDRAAVLAALAVWRTDPSRLTASSAHREHTFLPLPKRLAQWEACGVDTAPFLYGRSKARARYADLGLIDLLPLERVIVGAESARIGAWGGFHHPDQGYRHLQMVALITMAGPMGQAIPRVPELAMLDLLRAWAHDCLHYGSARRYMLVNGQLVRTQYGINWRRVDGRTYSGTDPQDSGHTRNLGVVMEGACDREARAITRRTAKRIGYTGPKGEGDPAWWAFRDITGQLPADADHPKAGDRIGGEAGAYVAAMGRYERGVNRRYESWLTEFGEGEREQLHDLVLTAVISGRTVELCRWLDDRHGPGAFAGMFRQGGYLSAPADA
jgi:hypothetical protein